MPIRIETRRRILWTPADLPEAEIELAHEPTDENTILHDLERGMVGYLVSDPDLQDPMEFDEGWGRYVSRDRRSIHGVSEEEFEAELAKLKKAMKDDDQFANEQPPNGVDGPAAKLRGK